MNNVQKVGAMIVLSGYVDGVNFEIISSPMLGGMRLYKFKTSDGYTIADYNTAKDTDVSGAFRGLLILALDQNVGKGMGAKIVKDMGEDGAYVFFLNKVKEKAMTKIQEDKNLVTPEQKNLAYYQTYAHLNKAYEFIDANKNLANPVDSQIEHFIAHTQENLGVGYIDTEDFMSSLGNEEKLVDGSYDTYVGRKYPWLKNKESMPDEKTNRLRSKILTALMMGSPEMIKSSFFPVSSIDNSPFVKLETLDGKNETMSFFHERETKYKDAKNLMKEITKLIQARADEDTPNDWQALYSDNHREALPILHQALATNGSDINLASYPYLKSAYLNLCYLNNIPIKGVKEFDPRILEDDDKVEEVFDKIYDIANRKQGESEFKSRFNFVKDGLKIGKIFGLENIFTEPFITGIDFSGGDVAEAKVSLASEIIEFMRECELVSKHAERGKVEWLYQLEGMHFDNPNQYPSAQPYIDAYSKHLKSLDGKHVPEMIELMKVQNMGADKIAEHLSNSVLQFTKDFNIPIKNLDEKKLFDVYTKHLLYICGQTKEDPTREILQLSRELIEKNEPKNLNEFLTNLNEEKYQELFGSLYNPDLVGEDDDDMFVNDDDAEDEDEYIIDMSQYRTGMSDYINALADWYAEQLHCDKYDESVYEALAELSFKLKNIITGAEEGDIALGDVIGLNQEGITNEDEQFTYLEIFDDELNYFFGVTKERDEEIGKEDTPIDYYKDPAIMSDLLINDMIELGGFNGTSPNLFKVINEMIETQKEIISEGGTPLLRQIGTTEYLVLEDLLGLTENCLETEEEQLEFLDKLKLEIESEKIEALGIKAPKNVEPVKLDLSVRKWSFYIEQLKLRFARAYNCKENDRRVIDGIFELVASSILLVQNKKGDMLSSDIKAMIGIDQEGLDTDEKKLYFLQQMLNELGKELAD